METMHTKRIMPVKKPCMIVYYNFVSRKVELRPYIDTSKKKYIWGVSVCGMAFKKTHEPDGDWLQAIACHEEKYQADLPTVKQLDVANQYCDCFNEVVFQLQQCGIEADAWRFGWYWSQEERCDDAVVVDMSSGRADLLPKQMKNGYIRLAAYMNAQPTFVSLPYTLLYEENGRLEPKLGFEPGNKNHPWGIRVDKKADFCLKREPELLTWFEAVKKAKKLSSEHIKYKLPVGSAIAHINRYAESIDDTLAILSAYGVDVDFFAEGRPQRIKYLTCDEKDAYFQTYENELIPKIKPCECRFVAQNV